jgi:hypothetical protein
VQLHAPRLLFLDRNAARAKPVTADRSAVFGTALTNAWQRSGVTVRERSQNMANKNGYTSFIAALAEMHDVVLSADWQQRILKSGPTRVHVSMAERSDLTADSLEFLKNLKAAPVRIALVTHQGDNPEFIEELAIGEKRQTVLDALVDVASLKDETVHLIAAATTSASLAAKLAVMDVFDNTERRRLVRVIAEKSSIAALTSAPLNARVSELCRQRPDMLTELIRGTTNLEKVLYFTRGEVGPVTVADAEYVIATVDTPDGNRFGSRTWARDDLLSQFRWATKSLLRTPGLSEESLECLRHALNEALVVSGEMNSHTSKFTQAGFKEELDFISRACDSGLYRAMSTTNATDLLYAVREVDSLPHSSASEIEFKDRLLELATANPVATPETVVAAFSRLRWPSPDHQDTVMALAPFTLEVAKVLVSMKRNTDERRSRVLLNTDKEHQRELLSFMITSDSIRVDKGQLFGFLLGKGLPADMLDMLSDSIPANVTRWPLNDSERADLLTLLSQKVMGALGDSDEAWHTFESLLASQASTEGGSTLVDMARIASKVTCHEVREAS